MAKELDTRDLINRRMAVEEELQKLLPDERNKITRDIQKACMSVTDPTTKAWECELPKLEAAVKNKSKSQGK